MGNRFSSSKAKYLEISLWLVFLGFPHGFHAVIYWGDPSYWNKTPNVEAKESAVQICASHKGKHRRTLTAITTSNILILLDFYVSLFSLRKASKWTNRLFFYIMLDSAKHLKPALTVCEWAALLQRMDCMIENRISFINGVSSFRSNSSHMTSV